MQRETIDYSERRASNQAPYQLFLFDPNGIKIELNFDQREPRAWPRRLSMRASRPT